MKKFILILVLLLNCIFFTACAVQTQNSGDSSSLAQSSKPHSSKESSSTQEESVHTHSLITMIEKASTCTVQGNIENYYCYSCKKYYSDENAENEISYDDTKAPLAPHTLSIQEEIYATCGETGVREHWLCSVCSNAYEDESGSKYLSKLDLITPTLSHENLQHYEANPIVGTQNGNVEYWYCEDCNGYFLDEQGKEEVDEVDTILFSAMNIPNFLVTVPEGRDPVILQLTDTQIIDGAQTPPEKHPNDRITYATALIQTYCYDYITEIVNATKPDLILLTGDLIYGLYDHNGSALLGLIKHMESFKIPWAPVFGNHEAESNMGVDWQCEQLENAEYCLFEKNNLSGSGNYSVGIVQGEKLTRVFYMLDSRGVSNASAKSLADDPGITIVGFGADQIQWYTKQIQRIKELSPQTKFSFAFHIQLSVFADAYAQYGFDNSVQDQNIFIDYLSNKKEGDFGYIGRYLKNGWDNAKTVYNGLKELGVDSIFVGHEHCNSASVVYEGIRFQYGQKSSEYDRFNAVDSTGKIFASYLYNNNHAKLVGGTVMSLSSETGEILNAYIYYCGNADQEIDTEIYTK